MKPKLITIHVGDNWQSQHKYALGVLSCLDQSQSWDVSVQRHVKRRSYPQLKALFGLAYKIICATTGYEKDELHTVMLGEFTGWEEVEILGVKRLVPKKTTSEMETKEMSEFYEFIQRRAAFIGVYIPDPNEYEQISEAA